MMGGEAGVGCVGKYGGSAVDDSRGGNGVKTVLKKKR
jgi:hypothetical protein